MPLKLGGYSKRYSDDNWFRADPEQQKCGVEVDWGTGLRPSARSLGVEDGHRSVGHRSLAVRWESIYYSQSFSEVP